MTSLIGSGSGSGWARNLKSKRTAITPQRNWHWGKWALAQGQMAGLGREGMERQLVCNHLTARSCRYYHLLRIELAVNGAYCFVRVRPQITAIENLTDIPRAP